MPTTTDNEDIWALVNKHKTALSAHEAASKVFWDFKSDDESDPVWYENHDRYIQTSEALRTIETQLCATFVWALEHSQK